MICIYVYDILHGSGISAKLWAKILRGKTKKKRNVKNVLVTRWELCGPEKYYIPRLETHSDGIRFLRGPYAYLWIYPQTHTVRTYRIFIYLFFFFEIFADILLK